VPVRARRGPVTAVIGVSRDATRRQQTEQALRENEAKYRALFDQASDGIMMMPVDGSSVTVNEAFARMHGYRTAAEMERIRLQDLDTPETARLAPQRLRRMMAGETLCFEVEHRHRDGHTLTLQVSCSVIRIGERSYFLGFHRDIGERKRIERALLESEQRFSQVADNAEEWVWETGREGTYTYCSPAVEKILGYAPGELVGRMRFQDLYVPDADAVVRQEGDGRFARRLPFKLFVRTALGKDGRRVILETNAVPFHAADGTFAGYRGADRDITASVQAEAARRESEEKYRGLVEATDTGFVMLDTTGRVRDANAEYIRMTGHRTLEEIRDRPVTDWTAPYDRERNQAEVVRCLRRGSVRMLEVDYAHEDGTIVPVEINATVIFTRRGPLVVTLCRDITARKRAEEALRDNEARYRQLVKHAPAGIFEFDYRTGTIDSANDVMSEYTGYSRDEILGMNPVDLLEDESRARHLRRLAQARAGEGLPEHVEYQIRCKDGSTIWGDFLSSYHYENGKPVRATTIVYDITARKRAEQALQESEERLRFLGDNLPGILFYQIDVGPDGRSRRFTFISNGVEQLHQVTAAEAKGDPQLIYGQVCGEHRALLAEREAAAIRAQSPFAAEVMVRLPSGEERWRQFISIPQPQRHKHLWDGIEIDVTERKRAEREMQELNQRFEYALGA
ncbi:PAS domain S-box protein, partial [bacterium]|nr:PAS domain S-box protein [bacterium]